MLFRLTGQQLLAAQVWVLVQDHAEALSTALCCPWLFPSCCHVWCEAYLHTDESFVLLLLLNQARTTAAAARSTAAKPAAF